MQGFFSWLGQHFAVHRIFVYCKNYADDPANPALDQPSGRFSSWRGKFGLLVCRTISDKALSAAMCRDTALYDKGFIVFVDHADLTELVEQVRNCVPIHDQYSLQESRMDSLMM